MIIPLFIFFGSKVSFFKMLWTKMFNNNAFIPIGVLLILCIITFIINIIFFIKAININSDMVKSNMIVKLVQIPAYIIIFIIGIVCLITIFTFAIS